MLELKKVSKAYGQTPALREVTLSIRKGEFLSLVGPSGCGKTTLLKIAAGLVSPDKGDISLPGGHTGIVFQDHVLLPWRTVRENVLLPVELGHGREKDVGRMLRLVGLSRFAGHKPHELSGGMRQRCAIARALVANSDLLLMDEPFGSLDEITRSRMNAELLALKDRLGLTVLFVTHSVQEAVFLSDRVAVLSGRPARIKKIVPVCLRRRKETTRETREFQRYVRCVRLQLGT